MQYDPARQALVDDEHLRLLSLGYYISAGITGVFSLLGLFYAFLGGVMGLMISQSARTAAANSGTPVSASADQVSQVAGLIFGVIGFVIFLFFITLAALKFFTGRCLKRRKSRTFCFVVSILCCLGVPYGTVLGACTILVLERPSVKCLFDANKSVPPSVTPAIATPNSATPPGV